jgi:hypothetical protein
MARGDGRRAFSINRFVDAVRILPRFDNPAKMHNALIRKSAVYGTAVHDIASVDGAHDMEKSARQDH